MANNYTKTMRQALEEAREYRDTTEGGPGSGPQKGGKKQTSANIKKAYGILNDPRYKQGNYSGAAKAIDKLSPGLSNHPDVKNAMKRANEEIEEEVNEAIEKEGSMVGKYKVVYDPMANEFGFVNKQAMKDNSKKVDGNSGIKKMMKQGKTVDQISKEFGMFKDAVKMMGEQVEDLDEATFSTSQIDALKKAYGSVGPGGEKNAMKMDKLEKLMSRYPKTMLNTLAKSDIPMVSKVAKELMK